MGWSAIIAAVLQLVGPLLSDLLKRWLDKLLNKVSAEMTVSSQDAEHETQRLLSAALNATPKVRIFRRALLRSMIAEVPTAVAAGAKKLPKTAANELQALAANAE
jgi:uncharacterized protein (DUF305 family)